MRCIRYLVVSLCLFTAMSSVAAPAFWQGLLHYSAATCPEPGKCKTAPNPPCPKGEHCNPTDGANVCHLASGATFNCASGETCCHVPSESTHVCIETSKQVSDCCIVGNTYCTGGRVCNYYDYEDPQGEVHKTFIGCVNPSERGQ